MPTRGELRSCPEPWHPLIHLRWGSSYDLTRDSMFSEPPTPPTRTTERLKSQLQDANASLEKLRRDMEDLQASNKRLNTKLRETKEESKRVMESNSAKSGIQMVSSSQFNTTIALTQAILSSPHRSSTRPSARLPIWKTRLAMNDRGCAQSPLSRRGSRRTRRRCSQNSAGLNQYVFPIKSLAPFILMIRT